jgi:hypothetical protein
LLCRELSQGLRYLEGAVVQVRVPRAAAVKGRVAVHLSGLEADINVLRRLKHPNIVRYLVRGCPR